MFVIKRVDDGKYVAKRGSAHSYTRKLEDAAVFYRRDLAQENACDNEYVCAVSNLLAGNLP